jgi:hypothetical protein
MIAEFFLKCEFYGEKTSRGVRRRKTGTRLSLASAHGGEEPPDSGSRAPAVKNSPALTLPDRRFALTGF